MNNIIILVAIMLILKKASEYDMLPGDPEDQTGSVLDQIPGIDDVQNYFEHQDDMTADQELNNVRAFLFAIRKAEGTATAEAYRALFGWTPSNNKTFDSFADHPRKYFNYTDKAGKTVRTSAAGAYQITATTFDLLVNKYGFTDFTPDTQDLMALKLIEEKSALADVKAGRLETAIRKVARVWASLPGANYNQPERQLAYIQQAYQSAGGSLA